MPGHEQRSGAPARRSRADVVGDGAAPEGGLLSLLAGRPAGRYAKDRSIGWGTPRRSGMLVPPWRAVAAVSAAVAAVLVALGLLQKRYCFDHGWGGTDVFWHACFSDLPRLWAVTPLASRAFPYSDTAPGIDQPVGTGTALWVLSWFVPLSPRSQQGFTAAWAIVAAACAVGIVVLTAATVRRHPHRAVLVGVSPLLVTVALVSPELLGVLLVSAGLWAWSRERPMAAGAFLGLAAVSRGYAVLVVLALGLVALRAGVLRAWCRAAGMAVLVGVGLLFVVQEVTGGVLAPYFGWVSRPADYGSLWYLPALADHPVPTGTVTVLAAFGWVLAVAAGALFTLLPARRPAVAEVCVVVVAVLLLTAKSVPVQVSLWLLPLAALAGVGWAPYTAWMSAEVLYFVAVWLFIGGGSDPDRALPASWYALFLVLRLAAIAWVAVSVVTRAGRRPRARATVGSPEKTDSTEDAADTGGESRRRTAAIEDDPDDAAGPAAGRRDDVVLVASR